MMSLFSRLLRRAPTPSAPPVPPEEPTRGSETAHAGQTVPDLARVVQTEEETLKAAIEARDESTMARLAIEGTSTKVRQRAAGEIEDPEVLRQLIRDVRGGRDKSVYKILTSKRDAL